MVDCSKPIPRLCLLGIHFWDRCSCRRCGMARYVDVAYLHKHEWIESPFRPPFLGHRAS
jgi:hypothetical protein